MTEDNLRYYKGIYKVRKISKQSPLKTALYEFLDPSPYGKIGVKHIIPVRHCHKKKKEVST